MKIDDRQYQTDAIESLRQGFRDGHRRQVLSASTGAGKCLGRNTPILMLDGTIKPVQDVVVGDRVMGPNGETRQVIALSAGRSEMYWVQPVKGDGYAVNGNHVLSLRTTPREAKLHLADGRVIECDGGVVNIPVSVYLASSTTAKHCLKGWRSSGVEFDRDDVSYPIPPYILGAWLGDGTARLAALTKPSCEMMSAWVDFIAENETGVRTEEKNGCSTCFATTGRIGPDADRNKVTMKFKELDLFNNKHIPDIYKFAPTASRLELIAGLLDSDGSISHNGYDWISKDQRIAEDLVFLCRSVGLSAYLSECTKGIKTTGFSGTYWRVSISGNTKSIPCKDKKAANRLQKKRDLVHGITVTPIGVDDYFGFEVDGDHLFLLGDFTVTHNSIIMLQMIQAAKDKGSKIIFICERRVLVDQFSKHLDAHGIDHGVLMAKHWRHRPDSLVQVATAQTLERMESWPKFDICFIDEVHVALRASVKRLLNARKELRVIGATATPFNPELGHYFSSVTSVITMRELVDRGYLVPYRVFVAHEIDTKGVATVAGEWKKDELEKRGQAIVGDVVADYIRISNEVWGKYRKTICFSCGIAHGADLAQKFNEAGINAVQISSNDEDEYRAEVLADFAKPDSDIKVVISVAILTRGFDQPDVKHVILARPLKKSFSEHVQMMGRVARPFEGDSFAVVQDNSGNFLRFQESWNKLYNEGVDTLDGDEDKKPRTEPTDKEKEASKCPKCGHLWGASDTCPHCGFIRSRRSDVVSIAGVMREIKVSDKKPEVDRLDYYAQLIGYANEYGKKPGYAYYKFIDRFKVDPPEMMPAPRPPSPEVIAWVKSRNIAYAKGMAKGRR